MARLSDLRAGRLLARPARVPAAGKPNILERFIRYIREVRTELARVDWPSRRELIASTMIVVVVLLVVALYLGFWDYIFTVIVKRWLIGP